MPNYIITADSTPDYDDWGFDDYWSSLDWITWHKRLTERHGLDEANRIFISAWNKQSIWDKPYNWYKYNSDFVDYFKSQGLNMSNPIASLITGSQRVVDSATSVAESVAKGTGNAVKGISFTLPLILLVGGAAFGLYQYNQIKGNRGPKGGWK